MPILTVTQINRYINFKIKEDRSLQGIMVKGEVSNFAGFHRSGHLYFTLKDKTCSVKAVMFASAASRLRFSLEDGMTVIAAGSVSVFERDGIYQLYVTDIQPDGVGAAYIESEQLKKKLASEGIFDTAHKRPLPVMPKRIGVVTSKSGAAVRDVINVLSRRYPVGELIIIDSQVQGAEAPDAVCRGLLKAEQFNCDVIIVGRGGGSSEDLAAFNTEKVAYAIYNCKVPVISAVGHESDVTISDLAADMRAATPSAAAELAAPPVHHLSEKIDIINRRLESLFKRILDVKKLRLSDLCGRLVRFSPENRLETGAKQLKSLEERLDAAINAKTEKCRLELDAKIAGLDALSPVKVLARGYSLVYKNGSLINDAGDLDIGDVINIQFGKGEIKAAITL